MMNPDTSADLTCANHNDVPAEYITIYHHEQTGEALCASCVTCTDSACGQAGTILDSEYREPWCSPHAAQYSGTETIHGPDLAALDSDRYRALTGQSGGV